MIYYSIIDPVAFALGPVTVHWYGLSYITAFLGCFALAYMQNKTRPLLNAEQFEEMCVYVALGVVLGGRVGYVLFYRFESLWQDPLWLFKIWEGGMSFHGGLLGVIVALVLLSRRNSIVFGDYLDLTAAAVPFGLFCGRIGNFINQELWGRVSTLPWSVIFERDPYALSRHPSQLYEAALEGVLLLLLLQYIYRCAPPRWTVSAWFALGYGVSRFSVEWLREPDAALWWGITRGQWLTIPMLLIGVTVLAIIFYNKKLSSH